MTSIFSYFGCHILWVWPLLNSKKLNSPTAGLYPTSFPLDHGWISIFSVKFWTGQNWPKNGGACGRFAGNPFMCKWLTNHTPERKTLIKKVKCAGKPEWIWCFGWDRVGMRSCLHVCTWFYGEGLEKFSGGIKKTLQNILFCNLFCKNGEICSLKL